MTPEEKKQRDREHSIKYYYANREKCMDRVREYRRLPWVRKWMNVYNRCIGDVKNHQHYADVEFSIGISDVKEMWFRDNASKMKKASIDRINPMAGYVVGNCRFVELKHNLSRKKKGTRQSAVPCSSPGCRRMSKCKNLCNLHYMKQYFLSKHTT